MARFALGLLPDESYRAAIDLTVAAERLGFEKLWVGDARFFRDAFATMTVCAAHSRRIGIGVAVTNPYTRSPAITALSIATVDEVSDGRAFLGLGAGGAGLKELCIERLKPIGAMRDSVQVIRQMLAGNAATKDGDVIRVHGAKLDFKTRKIPIYIGGHGPRLLELAGEIGDGVSMGGGRGSSKVGIEFALKRIRTGAARANRNLDDLDIMSWVGTSISEDADKAKDRMRGFVGIIIQNTKIPVLSTLGVKPDLAAAIKLDLERTGYGGKEMYSSNPEVTKKFGGIVPDELVDLLTIAGTPADCARKIKVLLSAGTKLVSMLPFPVHGMNKVQMVELFAAEVKPNFS